MFHNTCDCGFIYGRRGRTKTRKHSSWSACWYSIRLSMRAVLLHKAKCSLVVSLNREKFPFFLSSEVVSRLCKLLFRIKWIKMNLMFMQWTHERVAHSPAARHSYTETTTWLGLAWSSCSFAIAIKLWGFLRNGSFFITKASSPYSNYHRWDKATYSILFCPPLVVSRNDDDKRWRK